MLGVRTTTSSSRHSLPQGLELVVRLQPLRREARSRALEHAAQLDRVVDVAPGELAHHEAAAGERLEDAFVLERHECDPERRPRDPELLDQAKLGDALARLERSVEQKLTKAERRLRNMRFAWFPRGTTGSVTASEALLRAIGRQACLERQYRRSFCMHDRGAL